MRAQTTGPVLNKLRAFLLAPAGARDRRPAERRRSTSPAPSTRAPAAGAGCRRARSARTRAGCSARSSLRASGRRRSRAPPDPEQRRDCALYVDEVHNYLNLPTPLEEMLAEARGYRLSLCLAHQHLGQLPKEMREALAPTRAPSSTSSSPRRRHST